MLLKRTFAVHLGSFENLGGYYLVIDSLFLFLVPFLFIQNVEGSKDCSPSVLPSLAHKGLNLPKKFTNLHISDFSGPQNEKQLSYIKKVAKDLGLILYFIHVFTLGLTTLADIRNERQVYAMISLKC